MEENTLLAYLQNSLRDGEDVLFAGTNALTNKHVAYLVNDEVHVGWDIHDVLIYSYDKWWDRFLDFDKIPIEGLDKYDIQVTTRNNISDPNDSLESLLGSISFKYIDI